MLQHKKKEREERQGNNVSKDDRHLPWEIHPCWQLEQMRLHPLNPGVNPSQGQLEFVHRRDYRRPEGKKKMTKENEKRTTREKDEKREAQQQTVSLVQSNFLTQKNDRFEDERREKWAWKRMTRMRQRLSLSHQRLSISFFPHSFTLIHIHNVSLRQRNGGLYLFMHNTVLIVHLLHFPNPSFMSLILWTLVVHIYFASFSPSLFLLLLLPFHFRCPFPSIEYFTRAFFTLIVSDEREQRQQSISLFSKSKLVMEQEALPSLSFRSKQNSFTKITREMKKKRRLQRKKTISQDKQSREEDSAGKEKKGSRTRTSWQTRRKKVMQAVEEKDVREDGVEKRNASGITQTEGEETTRTRRRCSIQRTSRTRIERERGVEEKFSEQNQRSSSDRRKDRSPFSFFSLQETSSLSPPAPSSSSLFYFNNGWDERQIRSGPEESHGK